MWTTDSYVGRPNPPSSQASPIPFRSADRFQSHLYHGNHAGLAAVAPRLIPPPLLSHAAWSPKWSAGYPAGRGEQ